MLRSRAIREGSVGLFALVGLLVFGGITIWLRGGGWGEKNYQFTVSFPTVDGMQIGAPVRYRGVAVGKIVGLKPSTNKVEATIEISSANLQIPQNVRVQTNRYGLIGDASVDILPLTKLPPEVAQISPLGDDCDSTLIICQDDRLTGENAPDIFASMIELAEVYSDQAFVNNLNSATKNASVAAASLAKLTDDAAIVLRSAQKDISTVTQSATKTATDASRFIGNADRVVTANGTKITKTVDETSQLVSNLNLLIGSNRAKLVQTIDQINTATSELNKLAINMNTAVGRVNQTLEQTDTQTIVQNLETLTANAAEASSNLRALSNNLNDPTTLVTLQQTLDSARVTFANTQKLTSDLDQLLGDPQLRENIRILINGMSNLVSSADTLDEQIRIAKSLELVQQNLAQTSSSNLEVNDFYPRPSYLLPTQPKIIEQNKQEIKTVND